jgi:hypothetical protein
MALIKYVPPKNSLEEELMKRDSKNWKQLLFGWLLVIMTAILAFTILTTCEVQANGPPMVIDPTYGKLIWESEDGKVKMYRIVDDVEDITVICYPLVGQLHGKTVSNFCIYKPRKIGQ